MQQRVNKNILCAEDDDDHFLILKEILEELCKKGGVYRVKDGEELLYYLRHENGYLSEINSPKPSIILLDLNMPKKNGFEALKEIKTDPTLSGIPVIVLTVSDDKSDVKKCYELGANSYVTKPSDFRKFTDTISGIYRFWIDTVSLPEKTR